MCNDITDDVGYANNNQEFRVDEARDDEERSSVKETNDKVRRGKVRIIRNEVNLW